MHATMEGIATTPGVFITVFSRLWEMLLRDRTYFAKRWMMSLEKYKRTKTTRDLCPRRRRIVGRGGGGGEGAPYRRADAKSRTRRLRRRLQHRLLPFPLWTTRLFRACGGRRCRALTRRKSDRLLLDSETRRIFHRNVASRFGVFHRRTER